MRHFILPGAISRHPLRMLAPTVRRPLITPTSLPLFDAPRCPGAAGRAINLAAITVAADESQSVTTHAEKETRRRVRRSIECDETWTRIAWNGRMPPHSCPARCRARRRFTTWQEWPAPGLVSNLSSVLLQNRARYPWRAAGNQHCAGHGRTLVGATPLPPSGHARHNLSGNHIVKENSRGDAAAKTSGRRQFTRFTPLLATTDSLSSATDMKPGHLPPISRWKSRR